MCFVVDCTVKYYFDVPGNQYKGSLSFPGENGV